MKKIKSNRLNIVSLINSIILLILLILLFKLNAIPVFYSTIIVGILLYLIN